MKNIDNIVSQLNEGSFFTDSHCHLDMGSYQNRLVSTLNNADRARVDKIISIGIDLESSRQAVLLARRYKQVYATVGVHPHDVANTDETVYDELIKLYNSNHSYVVGYGEIGLDYVKQYSEPSLQRQHFQKQLHLANRLKLPVIIHNREADNDTISILEQSKAIENGGVMHCFSSDYPYAKKILDLGLMISIPGIVTFKNATTLHEVVKKIPISSMLIETDGPFLTPHPYRGKQNEPAYVAYTALKIAELRNCSVDLIARETTKNAARLFQIQ